MSASEKAISSTLRKSRVWDKDVFINIFLQSQELNKINKKVKVNCSKVPNDCQCFAIKTQFLIKLIY